MGNYTIERRRQVNTRTAATVNRGEEMKTDVSKTAQNAEWTKEDFQKEHGHAACEGGG